MEQLGGQRRLQGLFTRFGKLSKTSGIQPIAFGVEKADDAASGLALARIRRGFTDGFGLHPHHDTVECDQQ